MKTKDEIREMAAKTAAGYGSELVLASEAKCILSGGPLFFEGKGYPLAHEERISIAIIFLDRIIETWKSEKAASQVQAAEISACMLEKIRNQNS